MWHPACLKHATPGLCPETSLRLKAVMAELEDMQKLHGGKLTLRVAATEVTRAVPGLRGSRRGVCAAAC